MRTSNEQSGTAQTKVRASLSNWAGNYTYNAARLHHPQTLAQMQELVARSPSIKALGTRHSFNGIADTGGDLVSLEHFDQALSLDPQRGTVTVGAGMRYGSLGEYLHREGYALHNLASLPHISIAGACATATHGSGDNNGNLATAVQAIKMVTGDGNVVTLSRENDRERFQGSVVNLGALGIVTELTLTVEPAYQMGQVVYENLPWATLEAHFAEITASAYSISLFTDWQGETISQVWRKTRSVEGTPLASDMALEPFFFGATLAPEDRHPITRMSAENCTPQRGIPGPWHERLPHFRMGYTPSAGEELQSEYLVPREHAVAALGAIRRIAGQVVPVLLISEVRTVAEDDLWMSPCYQQPCAGLHFTWKKDWARVQTVLPLIEEALAPFQARPHWGKLFTVSGKRLRALYENLPQFEQLAQQSDPEGKFRNAFLKDLRG